MTRLENICKDLFSISGMTVVNHTYQGFLILFHFLNKNYIATHTGIKKRVKLNDMSSSRINKRVHLFISVFTLRNVIDLLILIFTNPSLFTYFILDNRKTLAKQNANDKLYSFVNLGGGTCHVHDQYDICLQLYAFTSPRYIL